MRYFDVNMIDDYLELGLKFKVFVNGDYLIVNDPDDLLNSQKGIGYDQNGKAHKFDYMEVDHVMVGSVVLTKQELNKKVTKPTEETPEEGDAEGEETTSADEVPDEDLENADTPKDEDEEDA